MRRNCKEPLLLPYQRGLLPIAYQAPAPAPFPHRVAQQPLRSKPHDGEKIATSPLKYAVQLQSVTAAAIPASTTTTTTTTRHNKGPAPSRMPHQGVLPTLMSEPYDGEKVTS